MASSNLVKCIQTKGISSVLEATNGYKRITNVLKKNFYLFFRNQLSLILQKVWQTRLVY